MKNVFVLAFALAATSYGCGVTEVVDLPAEPDQRFVYAPDPELFTSTEMALNSLQAASGLEFQVADWGTPVHAVSPGSLVQTVINDKGQRVQQAYCAWTLIEFYREPVFRVVSVEIQVERPARPECMHEEWRTIEHELIHSVRRYLAPGADDHSETGVFQPYANNYDNKLDADSLAMVCEAADCREFNPE